MRPGRKAGLVRAIAPAAFQLPAFS